MRRIYDPELALRQGSAQVGSSYQVIKLGSSYQAFDPMIQDQKTFLIT